ncbi:MAG TPA: phosphoribosylglycinamide formyltransferase [Conexibacter sp.]|nr:phosphoribosylglycinamide formyltransferase [Conexibacter sp.]
MSGHRAGRVAEGARSGGGAFRLAVLASGAGSNLQAILDTLHGGAEGIVVAAVASDKPGARALERAATAGVPTATFPLADFPDRAARDAALADWLAGHDVRLVVLAGYMQLLSPAFLRRFPHAVVNVHPALLPAFAGLDAVGQALAYGVKVFGVTVHFVDEGVDTGPIILQRARELPHARTREDVLDELHAVEHELLPEAIRLIARGAVAIDPADPRRVQLEP